MIWPDESSVLAFQGVVLFVLAAFIAGVVVSARPERRAWAALGATVGTLVWLGLTGGLVLVGYWDPAVPFPRAAPYLIGSFAMALTVGFSPLGRQLARGVPVFWLVGFQAFRLPLELVLHAWGNQGTVPVDITLLGENFDIVVGIAALVVAPLASRHRWLVWGFQILGLAMLLNILRIVALNTPGSPLYAVSEEPPLLLAAYLPMTWIVSVCVAGAFAGHFVLLRWLLTPESVKTDR